MRPALTRSRTRRAAILIGIVLVLGVPHAAHASDQGRDGAFCQRLRRDRDLFTAANQSKRSDPRAILAELNRLRRASPRRIRRDMGTLVGALRTLAKADPKDPKAFLRIFALVLDTNLITASNKVNKYARDVCKVELLTPGGASGSDNSAPPRTANGTGMDASTIRTYLSTRYPDAPWASRVNGVGVVLERQVEIDTDLAPGASTTGTAVEICQATSTYVYDRQHIADASISIINQDHRELASRTGASGRCTPSR